MSARRRRYRLEPGWTGVALSIVDELRDLLPRQAPEDAFAFFEPDPVHRFRDDGSFTIDTAAGTWTDHRNGEGGGIYSLLAKLLGSRTAAREWIRYDHYAELFSLAGIWSQFEDSDGHVDTFAVLTTDAATAIAHLHHRQPVLLDDAGVDGWLDPEAEEQELLATVQRPADGACDAWPVSRDVSDPRHNGAWLVERIAA